jgi:hypothetical protein
MARAMGSSTDDLADAQAASDFSNDRDAHEEQDLPDGSNYEILSVLGEGGMARVLKARDRDLDRLVALKVLRADVPLSLARLFTEARAQARVVHDHVCRVYEVGRFAQGPFIAMQLVDGNPLQAVARELDLRERVVLFCDVADAIEAAHANGLLHRDLKPANVLVERRGGASHAYVTDFGLARDLLKPGSTVQGALIGSPLYMAPEQAVPGGRLDARTDVYALGATLYELLVGRPPFLGGSSLQVLYRTLHEDPLAPRKLDPSLPVALERVVLQCLEKAPERRYRSAAVLAEDMRRHLRGESVRARRYGAIRRARRLVARHPSTSLLSVAVFLVIATLVASGIVVSRRERAAAAAARSFGLVSLFAVYPPQNYDGPRSRESRDLVATTTSPLPRGLVCGMTYTQSTDGLVFTPPGGVAIGVSWNNDLPGNGLAPTATLSTPPALTNVTYHAAFAGSCNGVATVGACSTYDATSWGVGPEVWYCHANPNPQSGYVLHGAPDSDDGYEFWNDSGSGPVPGGYTLPGPWGFIYQAYVGTVDVPAAVGAGGSDRFPLPKGTACGFTHTSNGGSLQGGIPNTDPGCMGYDPLSPDPAQRCPAGWQSRYAFDANSENGRQDCSLGLSTQPDCGFWGWCEYQDPRNLCDGRCLEDAVASGVAINIQSDKDPSGFAWCTRPDTHDTPGCTCYGGSLSSHFDAGRSWNEGINWCGNFQIVGRDNTPNSWNIPYYCSHLTTSCNTWNPVPNGSTDILGRPETDGGFCEQPCTGYVGCFADDPSRVLPSYLGSGLTIEGCEQAAHDSGFAYAGLEYGGQCFAGNGIDGLQQKGQTPNCEMTCAANTSEYCGGNWALSVYRVGNAPPAVANLSATGSVAIGTPSAIRVQWTMPADMPSGYLPSSYNVYRDGTKVGSTTSTTYVDTNVSDGSHAYNVTAVNAAGEGRVAVTPSWALAEH